jgi:hypothetical protein
MVNHPNRSKTWGVLQIQQDGRKEPISYRLTKKEAQKQADELAAKYPACRYVVSH